MYLQQPAAIMGTPSSLPILVYGLFWALLNHLGPVSGALGSFLGNVGAPHGYLEACLTSLCYIGLSWAILDHVESKLGNRRPSVGHLEACPVPSCAFLGQPGLQSALPESRLHATTTPCYYDYKYHHLILQTAIHCYGAMYHYTTSLFASIRYFQGWDSPK